MSDWGGIPKDLDKYVGFVYIIYNLNNGRKYVGKKFFWKTVKYPPLKGRKNKRHRRKQSDWEEYWGSNRELLEDYERSNGEGFIRTILKPCESKFDCAYYELKEQLERDVLFKKEYYNEIINVRLRRQAQI